MKIELTFKILTEKIIFTIFGSQSQSDIQSIQINDKIIRTKQREKRKLFEFFYISNLFQFQFHQVINGFQINILHYKTYVNMLN